VYSDLSLHQAVVDQVTKIMVPGDRADAAGVAEILAADREARETREASLHQKVNLDHQVVLAVDLTGKVQVPENQTVLQVQL
jgi:hypothetical protein